MRGGVETQRQIMTGGQEWVGVEQRGRDTVPSRWRWWEGLGKKRALCPYPIGGFCPCFPPHSILKASCCTTWLRHFPLLSSPINWLAAVLISSIESMGQSFHSPSCTCMFSAQALGFWESTNVGEQKEKKQSCGGTQEGKQWQVKWDAPLAMSSCGSPSTLPSWTIMLAYKSPTFGIEKEVRKIIFSTNTRQCFGRAW